MIISSSQHRLLVMIGQIVILLLLYSRLTIQQQQPSDPWLTDSQIQFDTNIMSAQVDLVSSTFRVPRSGIRSPYFVMTNVSNHIPCESFSTSFNRPSYNTLMKFSYKIHNTQSESLYNYEDQLGCFVESQSSSTSPILPSNCLPTSFGDWTTSMKRIGRCQDNDSPNSSPSVYNPNIILFNFKKSMFSYQSQKQEMLKGRDFMQSYPMIGYQMNGYWKQSVDALKSLLSNVAPLLQPYSDGGSDIRAAFTSVPSTAISSTTQQSIITQSIDTLTTRDDILLQIQLLVNSLSNIYDPALSSQTSSLISSILNQMSRLNNQLDNQFNIVSQFITLSNFNSNTFNSLSNPSQLILENYIEHATSTLLLMSISNEFILMNNVLNQSISTTFYQQSFNNHLIDVFSKIQIQLKDINELFIQKSGIDMNQPNDPSSTFVNQNPLICQYLQVSSLTGTLNDYVGVISQQPAAAVISNTLSMFGDLSTCRDMYQRQQSVAVELVVNSNRQFTSSTGYSNANIGTVDVSSNTWLLTSMVVGRSIYQPSTFATANYFYLGGKQEERANILIDEVRVHTRALDWSSLGYKQVDDLNKRSCLVSKMDVKCDSGKCMTCDTGKGFVSDKSACKCVCPIGKVNVGGRCVDPCPTGMIRRAGSLACGCGDGQFLVVGASYVTIASAVIGGSDPTNYYPSNNLRTVGVQGVAFYDAKGVAVTPVSCTSSSQDTTSCAVLYDAQSSTYWTSAQGAGYAWVTFTLPPSSNKISTISIYPLTTSQTMKDVVVYVNGTSPTSPYFGAVVTRISIPLQSNSISVPIPITDFQSIASASQSPLTFCQSCPTIMTFYDYVGQPQYLYSPSSNLPRTSITQCMCNGNVDSRTSNTLNNPLWTFYPPRFGCAPPLPTPTLIASSGSNRLGINQPLSLVSNIQNQPLPVIEEPITIRYTVNGDDPTLLSSIFPSTNTYTSSQIQTVNIKIRAYQGVNRIESAVSNQMFYFLGTITCTSQPLNATSYNASVTVFIQCVTLPSMDSSPAYWIFYTVDNSQPTGYSLRYNNNYGITLVPDPIVGINQVNIRVLANVSGFFEQYQQFQYTLTPKLPPPQFQPFGSNDFYNQVPITITPPYLDETATVPTYYSNYSIYYQLVANGVVQPPALTDTTGIIYTPSSLKYLTCPIPTSSCFIRIRSIGKKNDLISDIVEKYFKITFDIGYLKPIIENNYYKVQDVMEIKMDKNTDTQGVETRYVMVYNQVLDGDIDCSVSMVEQSDSTLYSGSFNLTLKGFYYIYARNFKVSGSANFAVGSNQTCKLVVYTVPIDPPIIDVEPINYVNNGYLLLEIKPNNSKFEHIPSFKFQLNNGIATPDNSFAMTPVGQTILNVTMSPQAMVQQFVLSVIDCPLDRFMCSDATTVSFTLIKTCQPPTYIPMAGNYIYNVSVGTVCTDGCVPRYESKGSLPSINSTLFPSSGILLSMKSVDLYQSAYQFSTACFHTTLGASVPRGARYTIDRYRRPTPPIIHLVNANTLLPNQTVTLTCSIQYTGETCSIHFSIFRYYEPTGQTLDSAPIPIEPIPSTAGQQGYAHQYQSAFHPSTPQVVGKIIIKAISVIQTTQLYDFTYSSEASFIVDVYTFTPRVELIPSLYLESMYYPNAEIILMKSILDYDLDYIPTLSLGDTDTNNSKISFNSNNNNNNNNGSGIISISSFTQFQTPIILSSSNYKIYSFVSGKYYIPTNQIDSWFLTYDFEKEKREADEKAKKKRLQWLALLVLLAPLVVLAYFATKRGIKKHKKAAYDSHVRKALKMDTDTVANRYRYSRK
ncbi:cell fusion related protein [Cavenderia fasciculata]|uniref:Cell fusion related protein n=1 Tax=Cavenderia fasciculata TaxID=261658 RepID=F4PMM3_CACFS|nr:cell fusion related protein [Cavenderia fasciculata]EGG22820.1 cell fusion related protein [Cavenderia fasciculata]|eukprot:XP_004360671.1 cell fusion related protein [Cavenderia fasciculata]